MVIKLKFHKLYPKLLEDHKRSSLFANELDTLIGPSIMEKESNLRRAITV